MTNLKKRFFLNFIVILSIVLNNGYAQSPKSRRRDKSLPIENTNLFTKIDNLKPSIHPGIKKIGKYLYKPKNIEFFYAKIDLNLGQIGLVGLPCKKKVTIKGRNLYSMEIGKVVNNKSNLSANILINGPFFDYDGNQFIIKKGERVMDPRYHIHTGEGCTTVESALIMDKKVIKPLDSTIHFKVRGLMTIDSENRVTIYDAQETMELNQRFISGDNDVLNISWAVGGYTLFSGQEKGSYPNYLPDTEEIFGDKSPQKKVARTVIGYSTNRYENSGKILDLVVVQPGPGKLKNTPSGASIRDIQDIATDLGLNKAINLDGGGSSQFWYKEAGKNDYSLVSPKGDCFPGTIAKDEKSCDRRWRPVPVYLYFR